MSDDDDVPDLCSDGGSDDGVPDLESEDTASAQHVTDSDEPPGLLEESSEDEDPRGNGTAAAASKAKPLEFKRGFLAPKRTASQEVAAPPAAAGSTSTAQSNGVGG